MNKVSKIFRPNYIIPKDALVRNRDISSKSQKLMLELGLIRSTGNGCFHLLPLLHKSLEKGIRIIDKHMQKVGAQKMTIPHLTNAELWKKSGRYQTANTELLITKDRHDKYQILSPTHEESITALLASMSPISYREFPLRLYQIGTKFRDELKPRFGLMRAKEFLMKDCYTFDSSRESALATYEKMNETYQNIFNEIQVPFVNVKGDTGIMGGSLSHEYQYPSDIGEDSLLQCLDCNFATNLEIFKDDKNICPHCKGNNIKANQGIEVGHTFLLDDKYSKTLGATFLQMNGKPAPLLMGCYGIGITRLIAASIEVLSSETEIRWPLKLAPFSVCIIPPKDGSKEQKNTEHFTTVIYNELTHLTNLSHDAVIVDDRNNLTIGKRMLDAKRIGYPIIVVIGSKANNDSNQIFEYHNIYKNITLDLNLSDLLHEIDKNC